MAKKAAKGGGTIRQRPGGRWEARYTVGRDPGTGKQIQRSVYGATQGEVRKKLAQITATLDAGTYKEPCRLTVGQWLDTWADTYLVGVKPRTVEAYRGHIKVNISPALGAVKLEALTAPMIQSFYNGLSAGREGKSGLSPKSVKNIHGVLHKALQQAVAVGYLRFNPADACKLPKVDRKEIHPLDEVESRAFLGAIQGHRFEALFSVALFTGMRQGELLGLPWEAVDLGKGTVIVKQQLQKDGSLASTKNSKPRTITPAPFVMATLKRHRGEQAAARLKAGELWEDSGLVFTDALGGHLTAPTIYHSFKKVVTAIGRPDARFHDLRHSYAVAAIRAGDDIKTVQGNLGHATASFTLDIYGHVTEQMKAASAARMEDYIKRITG